MPEPTDAPEDEPMPEDMPEPPTPEVLVEAVLAALEETPYEFERFLLGVERRGPLHEDPGRYRRAVGIALYELWQPLGRVVDFKRPELVIRLAVDDRGAPQISFESRALYLYGRYRKLERGISQARWLCMSCQGRGCRRCDGAGRHYTRSVQEEIGRVLGPAFGSTGLPSLHAAGREDVDVLMLGQGRPFVLEIPEPVQRSGDFRALERRVAEASGGAVEIQGLCRTDSDAPKRVKDLRADKSYRALCQPTSEGAPLPDEAAVAALTEAFTGRLIEQKTPTRVAHRRADLVRRRTVRELALVGREDEGLVFRIRAEAGTYIKELVSGDEGRTVPSLSAEAGVELVCARLDVLDIHAEDAATLNPPAAS